MRRSKRRAYDAAYLALAEKTSEPLATGNERLFNAVHGQSPQNGDYSPYRTGIFIGLDGVDWGLSHIALAVELPGLSIGGYIII